MTRFSETPVTGHPGAASHPGTTSHPGATGHPGQRLPDADLPPATHHGAEADRADRRQSPAWPPFDGPTAPTTTIDALRHQNALLRQTIALCDRLTAMALRGEGIASITDQFSRLIGHGVVVLDAMLSPLASAGWERDRSGDADPFGLTITYGHLRAVLAGARGPLRLPAVPGASGSEGCVVAPISVGGRLLGYVAVASAEEPVAGELDLFAVQHAATVYAQALLEEDRVGAFRLRFRREIFEALLRGHGDGDLDAVESARLIGLDPDQPYQVLAIAADERAAQAAGGLILETSVNALNHRWPDLVAVIGDEDVIVVAPPHLPSTQLLGTPGAPAGGDDRLGDRLLAFLQSRFPANSFTIGASRVTGTLGQLGTARDQARATLKLARRLGRTDSVTAYEELGFYRLLLAVPQPELRRFADEVLGPLVDYDDAHGSDLVSTLAAYLQTGGSPRHAAERLFVHPNTVVYRLGRIQSLIGVDLADPEDRLLCSAAVKGREALESRHAGSGPGAPEPNGSGQDDGE
ncbi:MAG: helix-turn-helix domain-containing protein [Acidimicrobiaceae bacterium]|nr:helix-turn-helix domain-containing protein [Acidimicrobiaceae bacterium]